MTRLIKFILCLLTLCIFVVLQWRKQRKEDSFHQRLTQQMEFTALNDTHNDVPLLEVRNGVLSTLADAEGDCIKIKASGALFVEGPPTEEDTITNVEMRWEGGE